MPGIADQIRGLPARDRGRLRAQEMARAIRAHGRRPGLRIAAQTIADYDLTINGIPVAVAVLSLQTSDNVLIADLDVIDGAGRPIPFSNPLIIVNPPILVPDGTKRIEIIEEGDAIELDNMIEDADRAFQNVISQTIAQL